MALPAIDEKWPSRPLRTGRSRRGFSPLLKAVQFSAARRAVLSAKSLENCSFPGQGGEELRTRNPPKKHKAGLVGAACRIQSCLGRYSIAAAHQEHLQQLRGLIRIDHAPLEQIVP